MSNFLLTRRLANLVCRAYQAHPAFAGLRKEIILLVGRRYCADPTKHISPFGLVCKEIY